LPNLKELASGCASRWRHRRASRRRWCWSVFRDVRRFSIRRWSRSIGIQHFKNVFASSKFDL